MSISGTVTTCDILSNTAFNVSGLSEVNLSTINITDDNGLDVSECFGITTNVITVDGTNVTLTGDCDTSLEILVTKGVNKPINCDYVKYEFQKSKILIFHFEDGSTSENIHPDCCTALGYDPEIGPDMYWVCRFSDVVDPNDCNNYTPRYETTREGWQVFDYISGGTVTSVPSAQCCYQYGFVDIYFRGGEVKCVLEVVDPCDGYTVIEPVPLTGPIPFRGPSGKTIDSVPSAECCTSLGFNYSPLRDGRFTCYQTSGDKPTVSITNDSCCDGSDGRKG